MTKAKAAKQTATTTKARSRSRTRKANTNGDATNGHITNGKTVVTRKSRSTSRSRTTNGSLSRDSSLTRRPLKMNGQNGTSRSSKSNGSAAHSQDGEGSTSSMTMLITYIVTGMNQGAMFIYLGIMPFLYKSYGMDPVTYGYVMSGYSFLQLCSSPILGKVADSLGSRTVLLLSMLSAAAAHFTMGISTGVPMLILSRVLSVFQDNMPASQMVVTDLVSQKDRASALGRIMIPMSAGMIVGPTLGGFLSGYFGKQGMLMITWMIPALAFLLTLTFIPAQTKVKSAADKQKKGGIDWSKLGHMFSNGDVPYLMFMRVLSTLPGMLFMMNFQLAGVTYFGLTPQGNGLVMSCLGVMNMINNGLVLGWLRKNMASETLMKGAALISTATYFSMSQTTEVWQLVLLLYPLNLAYSMMENQIMTRLTQSVSSDDTSTMVGIGAALFHLSRTMSPTLGGVLMQKLGWPAIGSVGFAVSIVMTSLAVLRKD